MAKRQNILCRFGRKLKFEKIHCQSFKGRELLFYKEITGTIVKKKLLFSRRSQTLRQQGESMSFNTEISDIQSDCEKA